MFCCSYYILLHSFVCVDYTYLGSTVCSLHLYLSKSIHLAVFCNSVRYLAGFSWSCESSRMFVSVFLVWFLCFASLFEVCSFLCSLLVLRSHLCHWVLSVFGLHDFCHGLFLVGRGMFPYPPHSPLWCSRGRVAGGQCSLGPAESCLDS